MWGVGGGGGGRDPVVREIGKLFLVAPPYKFKNGDSWKSGDFWSLVFSLELKNRRSEIGEVGQSRLHMWN